MVKAYGSSSKHLASAGQQTFKPLQLRPVESVSELDGVSASQNCVLTADIDNMAFLGDIVAILC